MVKRIWALLLCVVMSISLSACAENNLDRMYIEEAQLTEEEKTNILKKVSREFFLDKDILTKVFKDKTVYSRKNKHSNPKEDY